MTNLNPTFARRLILAHLIETLQRPSVPALMDATGWPRRTIQDALKSLPEYGLQIAFVEEGVRHNDGYYRVTDWGPFDARWIAARWPALRQQMQLPDDSAPR